MNPARRSPASLAMLVLLAFGPASPIHAQAAGGSKASKDPGGAKDTGSSLSDKFDGVEFRTIGPFRGGRVTAVTGVPSAPQTFYMGATGGGVWKTTDGGSNWQVLSDKDFKTGSIGAIDVSESDPNIVYVGTGEEPIRGNVAKGDGVYKSTDGGRTWKNVGLRDTRQIARIRIHPSNPDLVYVAAQGHVWGPNAERGIFRSEDGGKTWKKILFVDDKTGASDLAMDPTNPRILYAGFWQVVRHPWELVSGGAGSSLWKSTDGGDTWKKLTSGLPDGIWGKVGVAVAASRPSRVYAFVEAGHGGLFRSENYGEKFTHVNDEHKIRERAWYYSWVYPDPSNPDVVYLPNVQMHKSIDGGKTFQTLHVPHGDNHDMWIDPKDSSRFIVGNDGGATITYNGGTSWSTLQNQPTAQFYRVTTDNQFPYWVYGSQQDNSNVCIPSGVAGSDAIGRTEWHAAGGGESGWMAVDPNDPNIVYAGEYGGQITRYDHRTRQERNIMAWPQLADGHATSDLKYRFQWNAPIMISPNDPKALYHASQILLRSRDGGETWEEISPDLTRNDKSKQGKSGGPITIDVTGVELFSTIFALGESAADPGVIWAGSDDGLVHVTRDNGKTWQNVTPKGIPDWIQINAIDASPRTKGTAYVAATMYKWDDDRPYLYKTSDYGKTWTKIVAGIPDGAFTRVVREDPVRPGLLYAGTELGLYVSFDDGASWQPFQRNLPPVPITDLAVKNDDLVVATQGRAFWILDDLTPLRKWGDAVASSDAYLFPPRATVRMDVDASDEDEDEPQTAGRNMPGGVIVDYWLKDAPGERAKVTLEFFDGDTLLRSYSNEKSPKLDDLKAEAARAEEQKDKDKPLDPKAGINRFVWDMRIVKPSLAPKTVFNEGTKNPPKVAPGNYAVKLIVDGKTYTQPIVVQPHPAGYATAADLKAQHELLKAVRDRLTETHDTVQQIRDVRSQLDAIGARAARLGKGDALSKQAAAISTRLTAVEDELTNPEIVADEDDLNYEPKLDHDWVYLAAVVASADAKPLASSVQYYDVLKGRLDTARSQYKAILDSDVKAFNQAVVAAGIPPVAPAPKAAG